MDESTKGMIKSPITFDEDCYYEKGIDISNQYSKIIQDLAGKKFDYVITVCDKAKKLCPTLPGKYKALHWNIDDPGEIPGTDEDRLKAFRETRDLLFKYPRDYYASLLEEVEIYGKDYYVLKLDPKEGVHGYIKTMKIWVNTDSYLIAKIEYIDFNGNVSTFAVYNVDIETELPKRLFQFEIEEGVDVVDLRM